jgi:Na+-driven multidrug efflux pump
VVSAASIIMGAYIGQKDYESLIGGLLFGTGIATLIIILICRYAYRHSQLNRIQLE